MNTAVDHYLSSRRGMELPGMGLPWLDSLREKGSERFSQLGFPTLRDEDWRHTNLRPLLKSEFLPIESSPGGPTLAQLPSSLIEGLDSHRLVFVDGRFDSTQSSLNGCEAGLTLGSMADVLSSGAAGVEKLLGSCGPSETNSFTALNTAFIGDGVYLKVEDGCCVDRPVEIVFVGTERADQLVQPRNLYVVGRAASVEIVEHYVSVADNRYFTNVVSELIAHEDSVVEHTKLQEEGSKTFHVAGLYISAFDNASVVSNNIAVGSLIARTDLYAGLKASGARCSLNGMYLANARQHIDNFTQVDHEQPDCSSDQFYKGVLDNRARAVFRGRVVVHEDAQHTDAQQQNRNLLLSDDAEIDTKPQLEIYADDVKCSHGATVGQLDDDALFYLRSRAIDDATARSLLTYAFAADVIGRLSLKPIRDRVESLLSRKLFDVDRLEDIV